MVNRHRGERVFGKLWFIIIIEDCMNEERIKIFVEQSSGWIELNWICLEIGKEFISIFEL